MPIIGAILSLAPRFPNASWLVESMSRANLDNGSDFMNCCTDCPTQSGTVKEIRKCTIV